MTQEKETKPEGGEESMAAMTNDDLIAMVREKIGEKDEVIKEQQIQIQELQEQVNKLDAEMGDLKKAEYDREELVKNLSAILE